MNQKKRLINYILNIGSVVLCLMLIAGMVPMAALAAGPGDLTVTPPECVVTTVEELKDALNTGKSEIGIFGMISLSESVELANDISLVGMDSNSGFIRASDYTGSLFSFHGEAAPINVNIYNVTFDGNNVEANDTMVSAVNTSLTITASAFCKCTVVTPPETEIKGSALYVESSNVSINDTLFENNSITETTQSKGFGGAVYLYNSTAELIGCEFNGNMLLNSRGNGIALYCAKGVYSITDTSFIGNTSDGSSYGSVYIYEGDEADDTVQLIVSGCTFTENSTQGCGSAISTPYDGRTGYKKRTVVIQNTEITNNSSIYDGGALLICGTDLTIDNTNVDYNYSKYIGGGALFYHCNATISNSSFSHNTCEEGCSGGIHVWVSVIEMNEVDMCYNTSRDEGGGMCIYVSEYDPKDEEGIVRPCPTSVTFNGGSISFNKTVGPPLDEANYHYQSNGGGVFVHSDATFIFNDGIIQGNSSCLSGGGVYVDDESWINTYDDEWINAIYIDNSGTFIMNGGMICDNSAAVSGGGVFVADATGEGRRIPVPIDKRDSARFIMNGGTIRDNTAQENGGGVYVQYAETPVTFIMQENAYVFDNKANNNPSNAGDDIYDETDPEKTKKIVNYVYPKREYSDILEENCIITPFEGYEIPSALSIPFINWYIDEAADAEGSSHRFVNLDSPVPADDMLNKTTGLKAIWGGYLLMYDANDGSGETKINNAAYKPGENVEVDDNMFTGLENMVFKGWNTSTDGSGSWYYPGTNVNQVQMNSNTILYAQWSIEETVEYIVVYTVEEDAVYGTPENSEVPIDVNKYSYGDIVEVKDGLSTTQNYAFANGEKIPGEWVFILWDKQDFEITEDTIITGGWRFNPIIPAPAEGNQTGTNPKTGQSSYLVLWIAIITLSSCCLGAITVTQQKKESMMKMQFEKKGSLCLYNRATIRR